MDLEAQERRVGVNNAHGGEKWLIPLTRKN